MFEFIFSLKIYNTGLTMPGYVLSETSPGANDNASGCAVMIEMARIIFENNLKPYHNIDFMAYDAESLQNISSKQIIIPINDLNSGIYFMRITSENGIETKKIIKN